MIQSQQTISKQENGKLQKSLRVCPYTSTIRKNLLDFDFEKICSITLAHNNIYACLVCGRYFQGKSATSPAYQHSIQFSHYIYINLHNSRVYCLPDDYQVQAYTLSDVKANLKPTFTLQQLVFLEKMEDKQYNVDGKEFTPGAIGINNLGNTDFATTVIYLLNSVRQIRHFFILHQEFQSQFLNQLSTLMKKIWNAKNFKGIVSPHQFLQQITDLSMKKFKIGSQSDPSTFFLWLIDNLSKFLKKQKKSAKLNIQGLFRGKLKTSIIKGIQNSHEYEQIPTKISQIPFSILKLQFPQKGVFNKTQSQVSLDSLLEKYVGRAGEKHEQGLRYAKIIQFPQHLVLVYKRFMNNGYTIEKDNSHLLYGFKLNIESNGQRAHYQLIAQICHLGDYQNGKYKIHFCIQNNQNTKWFEIQDLQAKQLIEKQVLLGQPYIQLYKLIRLNKQKTKQENEMEQRN